MWSNWTPPFPLPTSPCIRTWLFNKAKPKLDELLASKKEHRGGFLTQISYSMQEQVAV